MTQARRLFEGAALCAAMGAAFGAVMATAPVAVAQEAEGEPPKAADYQVSIQCAGLHAALAVFSPNDGARNDKRHADRFTEWARMRAPEAGKNNAAVSADIETIRKSFVRDGGRGSNATRWKRLVDRYNSMWNTCRNLSDVQEYLSVNGK